MAKEQYYIDLMNEPWENKTHPAKVDILRKRIEVTTSCRDCDHLPRVENAGEYMVDEDGNAVQYMHNGLKVLYGRYYGHWTNEIIKTLRGVHEPQEEKVFYEILKYIPAGSTMVEAGCYWGYYSMWFAKEVADAKSYLVEPHPKQMQIAQRNFELNGLTGDFTCAYFGDYPEKKKQIQLSRVDELPELTLPEFMARKGLDRITLMHADIQGHEQAMLEGAKDLLDARKIDYLFISTHGSRHPACKAILENSGYRILAEHDIGESASADGLLVAQNPDLDEIPPIDISVADGIVQAHS